MKNKPTRKSVIKKVKGDEEPPQSNEHTVPPFPIFIGRPNPAIYRTGKEGIEAFDKALKEEATKEQDKDTTDFNKAIEAEEAEKAKLPIDKLIEIATKNNLLRKPTESERWATFIRGINLHDIVKDCMQSSFNVFAIKYNKTHEKEDIAFKISIRKQKRDNSILGVAMVLEMRRYGLYKDVMHKTVSFRHIRELKQDHVWKYALYGAIYNSLIEMALAHIITLDDVDTGRVKL